jgi:iron(III) transport system ATP-binding protein
MLPSSTPGLACRGLHKSYGRRTVLNGLDLAVERGRLAAILGASGTGKTTFLRLVMGLEALDAGQVAVGTEVVAGDGLHVPTARRRVGYVSQDGALFPHLTAGENVGFGLPRGERRTAARIHEVLQLVGLGPEFVSRHPSELSGGEQRRIALARALAPRPRVILFDEPFSGLDAGLRADIREAVLGALAREEATAVLVTHDQAEALSMGDQVGVLRDGKLVQMTVPEALYREPADLDVARFVGEAVVLPGQATDSTVHCVQGSFPTTGPVREGPVVVMIRPEQIRVEPVRGVGPAGSDNPSEPGGRLLCARKPAVVVRRRFFGSEVAVSLRVGGESTAMHEVSARVASHEAPDMGQTVHVWVVGSVRTYEVEVEVPNAVRSNEGSG